MIVGLHISVRNGRTICADKSRRYNIVHRHLAVYSGGRKTIKVTFRVRTDGRECEKGIQNGEKDVGLNVNLNVTKPQLFSDISSLLFCNHIQKHTYCRNIYCRAFLHNQSYTFLLLFLNRRHNTT
jgi:hypothetical protein